MNEWNRWSWDLEYRIARAQDDAAARRRGQLAFELERSDPEARAAPWWGASR